MEQVLSVSSIVIKDLKTTLVFLFWDRFLCEQAEAHRSNDQTNQKTKSRSIKQNHTPDSCSKMPALENDARPICWDACMPSRLEIRHQRSPGRSCSRWRNWVNPSFSTQRLVSLLVAHQVTPRRITNRHEGLSAMSLTEDACGADRHTETIRSVSLEAKLAIARCYPHSPHVRPSPTSKSEPP